MEYFETLGKRINYIRNTYNLSQKAFADKLYVTASYISKVEKDIETPSDMFIKLLSYEFNHEFNWIKTGSYEEIDVASKENALQYYDLKIKGLNNFISRLDTEDILIIADTLYAILDLLDNGLKKENKTIFYNTLDDLVSLISAPITYLQIHGEQIKKDYYKLLLFRTDFDKTTLKITDDIKKMLQCYIKEYDIDIEIE